MNVYNDQRLRPNSDWQQDLERLKVIRRNEETTPDLARMAAYRYARLQAQIARHDCAGALLFSPMNVRYATETVYAPITNMHSPTRAVFVPNEGSAVLYDSAPPNSFSIPDFVGEVREAPLTAYFIAGDAYANRSRGWASEIADLARTYGGDSKRIAIDMFEPEFILALHGVGLEIVNAERLVERAGAVKSDDELQCIVASVAVAERGLARIREHLQAGVTEQALWAHLPYENAMHGGGWFEYAILTSGERTNPWGQECSDKLIIAGELVTVDTGMIGPFGYGADISRTFYCQPATPSPEQKRLYRTAFENLSVNIELIRAGLSFREFAERSWSVPREFWARRYNSVAHGVGMGNEWPHIPFAPDWDDNDKREDVFEENMVMAIESCIGREDGRECVKLEEMVVVTNGKCQLLSTFPFEAELLA
ncbi:Xaa-Pro peptidase family protein [Chloroflexi bacterium TSY]|nr:Xaa-Pro peptidase family protein [Chloroflexi bacterium TSY]